MADEILDSFLEDILDGNADDLLEEDTFKDLDAPKVITVEDMVPDTNAQQMETKKEEQFDTLDKIIDKDTLAAPTTFHEKEMWNAIDQFEISSWDPTNRGLTLGDPKLDRAMNGLQTGVHIIAGCANHGKSAMLSDIEVGVITNNEDAYVLSFSLDDGFADKFARISAILNKTTINFMKNPIRQNIIQDPNDFFYIKWKNSVTKIRSFVSRYMMYDGTFGHTIEEIEKKVIEVLAELEELSIRTGKKKKLAVFIDSFHDLDTSVVSKSEDKVTYIATWARDFAVKHNIPIVCTAELKKLNAHKRPILDDIRDSIKLQYAAKSIMLLYNEVSQKSEGAQIYYTATNEAGKQPVIELYFAKNKLTEYKGRIFYLFRPDMVKLVSANEDNTRKWLQKIYG